MTLGNTILEYRSSLAALAPPLFLSRRFITAEAWTNATTQGGRYLGLFREQEPDLAEVLEHRHILILGEPGAGKSTTARAIVQHLLSPGRPTEVPILASLKSYRGDLRALLAQYGPAEILDTGEITRTYVLDGIDEVAPEYRDDLLHELNELLATDARVVLTARQAYYIQHRTAFPEGITSYHLLDFDDKDIRSYATHQGVDPGAFLEVAHENECDDLIRNPFLLSVMLEYYQEHRSLGRTRSENVAYAIERLIHSRPLFAALRQRRALRMLAVACETAARNELTEEEAVRVLLEAIEFPPETAKQLLDELSQSILVRTAGGISFQMRSFGEYLAAEELHDKTIDRLMELAFAGDRPVDTWLNTITYLAELNDKVRRYFARYHPEWLITVSPAAFTTDERTALTRTLLDISNAEQTYLVNQERFSLLRFASLLTPATLAELRTQLESHQEHEIANSLVLLAIHHEPNIVPRALQLATVHRNASPLRYSAIVALINAGDPSAVPSLLAFADREDNYYLSIVDAIGSLGTPADFSAVLPLLEGTNAGLSAAYYHFRELTSKDALLAAINYLTAHPTSFNGYHLDTYLDPIIDLIPNYWDEDIAGRLGRLLAALERIRFRQGKLAERIVGHLARIDEHALAIRALIIALQQDGTHLQFINYLIARSLITPQAAQWISEHAPTYANDLAPYLPPGPARDILAPQTPELARAEATARAHYREEQAREEQAAATTRAQGQHTMRTSRDMNTIIVASANLRKEHWPDISDEQRAWLTEQVTSTLVGFNLAHSVRWQGDREWTHPRTLEPVLELTNFYALRLTNDVPIILALKSWPYESISNYYRREGITPAAQLQLTTLLEEREHENITGNIITFLRTTGYDAPRVQELLAAIALDATRTTMIRGAAIERLNEEDAATTTLQTLAGDQEASIRTQATRQLIKRQHEATIYQRLLAVTDYDLREGDVPFPNTSALDWIGDITSRSAINQLRGLRQRALTIALWRPTSLITGTLAKIDKNRAADIVTEQLPVAPAAWRQRLKEEAANLHREARIEAAQQTPFDMVIRKLKGATSMIRIKVWCEGSTDRPILGKLLVDLGETDIADTLDFVGGWGNLTSEHHPERWLDGCREAIMIMDGDRGRKLKQRDQPFTDEAKDIERRFQGHRLTLYVLRRYGIENYFPRQALETVLRRNLSAYFPIPPDTRIEDHLVDPAPWWRRLLRLIQRRKPPSFFRKNLNEEVANHLTLADLETTDLAEVLSRIKKRAEEARQY